MLGKQERSSHEALPPQCQSKPWACTFFCRSHLARFAFPERSATSKTIALTRLDEQFLFSCDGKEEVKESFGLGAENVEKKELPSNTAQPFLAAGREEDLETEASAQSLGQGSRFQRLPEDLEEVIGNRIFVNEDDFAATLEELKITDEPIVLGDDGKAYYYIPGDVHNAATAQCDGILLLVTQRERIAQEDTNVKLGPRLAGAPPPLKRRRPTKRLPDVALWGKSKCELKENGDISKPLRVSPASPQPVVHPHVVVQISIFNDEDYEVDAINDLATRAVAGQGAQPNLGVLIKHREAALGVPAGFDIILSSGGNFLGRCTKSDQLSTTCRVHPHILPTFPFEKQQRYRS